MWVRALSRSGPSPDRPWHTPRMADKDPESGEASLELPSFGFARRRRTSPEIDPAAGTTRLRLRRPEPRGAEAEPPGARPEREVRFPSLPALPAVLLVGAVVGLAAVLLTYGSLRLCDVATGTATCGGGPGLLLMLAILISLTYLGGWLLRGFGISDAGSTSFLAV